MAFPLLATVWSFVGHSIPFYLLAFGVILLVLGTAFRDALGLFVIPMAFFTIAVTLAYFLTAGTGYGGLFFLPADVLVVVGVGIVALILAKFFSYF